MSGFINGLRDSIDPGGNGQVTIACKGSIGKAFTNNGKMIAKGNHVVHIVKANETITTASLNFYPLDLFSLQPINRHPQIALILLNGDAACSCLSSHIEHMWSKSVVQVCADGSANRLYTMDKNLIPSIICGDLDSCDRNVMEFYSKKNTEISRFEDQSSTDFTKCINMLKQRKYLDGDKTDAIVTLGGLCGRFDHVMGCLESLFIARTKFQIEKPVYILHNDSIVFLIPKGQHKIFIDKTYTTGKFGLIPLGCPAKCVTTNGLQWNLSE
uniref:Thiamin pyrophosphokinase catalytic domain-containing protein n=1 Tax=Romanomermis culicivorax TaxID=13658 RepID=A0A915JZN9_ROMCU